MILNNIYKYPTTNSDIIEMKRELKFNQSRIKRISKLVKFNINLYRVINSDNFFSDHIGKTRSYSKSILSTVEELIDCKIDLEFRCKELGLEIQRERQRISDKERYWFGDVWGSE